MIRQLPIQVCSPDYLWAAPCHSLSCRHLASQVSLSGTSRFSRCPLRKVVMAVRQMEPPRQPLCLCPPHHHPPRQPPCLCPPHHHPPSAPLRLQLPLRQRHRWCAACAMLLSLGAWKTGVLCRASCAACILETSCTTGD